MLGEEGRVRYSGQGTRASQNLLAVRGLPLKANRARGGCAPGAKLLSEGRLAANVRDCRTKASVKECTSIYISRGLSMNVADFAYWGHHGRMISSIIPST